MATEKKDLTAKRTLARKGRQEKEKSQPNKPQKCGWEGARTNSLETWKSKAAKARPAQNQQRALPLYVAISKGVH